MGKVSPYVFPGIQGMEGSLLMASFAKEVCERLNLKYAEVNSPCRRRELVNCRFAIYHALIKREKKTTMEVGRFFNRDHSSVVHGVKTWTNLLSVHDDHAWRIQEIVNMVYHHHIIFTSGKSKTTGHQP